MPDEISPVRMAVVSYKAIWRLRPWSLFCGVLLIVVSGVEYGVIGDLPPDPFTWLIYGLPLLLLLAPILVCTFHLFMGGQVRPTTVLPERFHRKTFRVLGWYIGFSIFFGMAAWSFKLGVGLILPVSALVGEVPGLLFALVSGLIFMAVPGWFLVCNSLMFPGIVAGDETPFSSAHILLGGNVVRYVGSFVLVMLPVGLVEGVLLIAPDLMPQLGGTVSTLYGTPGSLGAVFWRVFAEAMGTLVGVSWLSVWYTELKSHSIKGDPSEEVPKEVEG